MTNEARMSVAQQHDRDIKVLENILKDFPLLLSRTINSRKMVERIVIYNQLEWVRDRIEIVKLSLEEKSKLPEPYEGV